MTDQDQVTIVEDYLRNVIELVMISFGDGDEIEEEDLEDTKLLAEMVANLVVNALDLHILESDGEHLKAALTLRKDEEWMDDWADSIEERLDPL